MSDIRKLIEAVEGPAAIRRTWAKDALGSPHLSAYVDHAANGGSLDAARALHEALIPSCQANVELSGEVWVLGDETEWMYIEAKVYDNPARAWILAILKAYETQQ